LFELADNQRALDQVAGDLQDLKRMLAESADLQRLVSSPIMPREEQRRGILAVAERSELSSLTRRFLGVLAENRRLFLLGSVIDGYLAELAKRRGEMTVDVTAAHALNHDQMAAVTDALNRSLGSKVSVNVKVDPSILGGLIVKVGSRLIDSSVKTKLDRLQLAMKGAA
jgi:F-type H+-transporting ATPase subunit delta